MCFNGLSLIQTLSVNFQCRLSFGVRTPPWAIACVNICAYVKDPFVHVRVWLVMEALKHPACIVGRVARLGRSWFARGRQPEFPIGEIPMGQYSCKKTKKTKTKQKNKQNKKQTNKQTKHHRTDKRKSWFIFASNISIYVSSRPHLSG